MVKQQNLVQKFLILSVKSWSNYCKDGKIKFLGVWKILIENFEEKNRKAKNSEW
jgi:hypothetical protein